MEVVFRKGHEESGGKSLFLVKKVNFSVDRREIFVTVYGDRFFIFNLCEFLINSNGIHLCFEYFVGFKYSGKSLLAK